MTLTEIPIDGNVMAGPPRVTVLGSARRHWIIVVLSVLVFVGGAAFLGLRRDAIYTSEARLTVGRIDVSAPGALAGFSVATQSLAAGYSRAVDAPDVVDLTARKVKLSSTDVANRTDATPLPQSAVFRVIATGPSEQEAVKLANTTSDSLLNYIIGLNRSNPDSGRLFDQFHDAALLVQQRANKRNRLQASFDRKPSPATRRALDAATAAADSATLRRDSVRSLYQTSVQGQSTTSLVQVLAPAAQATSDRGPRLQLFLLLGLVAGLLLGLAFATLRASRAAARALF